MLITNRRVRILVLSTVMPLAALILLLPAFLQAASTPDREGGLDVNYLAGEASLRTCPRVTCPAVTTYDAGEKILVIREVSGDTVHDSSTWSEVRLQTGNAYIHSSLLLTQPIAIRSLPELLFTIGSMLVVIFTGTVSGLQRLSVVDRIADADLSGIVSGIVVTVGLLACLVSLQFSQVVGGSLTSFLSTALINIGSGLIGAGIAFVLFQSIWRDRKGREEEIQGAIEKLQRQLDELRQNDMPNLEDHSAARLGDLGRDVDRKLQSISDLIAQGPRTAIRTGRRRRGRVAPVSRRRLQK